VSSLRKRKTTYTLEQIKAKQRAEAPARTWQPSASDLEAASFHMATLSPSDPIRNLDTSEVARLLMEVEENVDSIQIVDDAVPGRRHFKVIPRDPWRMAGFRETGIKLGQLLGAPVSFVEAPNDPTRFVNRRNGAKSFVG